MYSIGIPCSRKENEYRRAIVPEDIKKMNNPSALYFEKGYGEVLKISDEEYIASGAHICEFEECITKDVICDPKIGDAEYLEDLPLNTSIFGWIHATQNRDITDKLIERKLTGYAWEKMYYKGRHIFWRNNELAGEAAVLHAFQCYSRMPYETNVAVIGKGNTARGAIKVLNMLGASVVQYDRKSEKLLREEIDKYDVIVNCILWDVSRKDHIIYRDDLKRMQKDSMIIDVSCDRFGGIETCIPTTIENPTYYVEGVMHYAVDHTPAIFYKTFTYNNSSIIYPYLDMLATGNHNETISDAMIINNGVIVDKEIIEHQNRY